jgi:hypothetical protein
MKSIRSKSKFAAVIGLGLAAALADIPFDGLQPLAPTFARAAEARVGHPLTPGSVAGTARRTTRRVIRRSTVYVAALPAGCAQMTISGALVWRCGATYYQPYNGRYVVVYID